MTGNSILVTGSKYSETIKKTANRRKSIGNKRAFLSLTLRFEIQFPKSGKDSVGQELFIKQHKRSVE